MSPRLAADLLSVGGARSATPRPAAGREPDMTAANERAMRRFTLLWRLGVVAMVAAGVLVAGALAAPGRVAEEELIWLTPYHSRG
jgi:hypothetical protein